MRCYRWCGRDTRCRIPPSLSERGHLRARSAQRRATTSCLAVVA